MLATAGLLGPIIATNIVGSAIVEMDLPALDLGQLVACFIQGRRA